MTPAGESSAGYRIYRLFPVSRRVEAERNALPIGVASLPLTAVLLGDYPIKLERFAGIEVPGILPRPRRTKAADVASRCAPAPAGRARMPLSRRQIGMTARMYLSSVGWPRAGREM
jgi:hypothetical protein